MTGQDQDQQDPLEQLHGSVGKLIDPFLPSVDPEDWEALRDD